MNWRTWLEVDGLLLERNIKSIIAVIPDDKNQAFFMEKEKKGEFLELRKGGQKIGWIIGVHGY
jgi:hypothetical protein